MTDYMELNKITDLINYIDSEMTGVKDKILEIDKVVFQVDSKTKTGTDPVANSRLLGLESKKFSLLIEYDLLLTRYGKLVEQRRDVLDTNIRTLCKKDTVLYTDDNRTIEI